MTADLRQMLREAVDAAQRARTAPPAQYACGGCGTDRRHGYSNGCGVCLDRNAGRRRRGNPDGWRVVQIGHGRWEWQYSAAWLDAATDPKYDPLDRAKDNARRTKRRRALAAA